MGISGGADVILLHFIDMTAAWRGTGVGEGLQEAAGQCRREAMVC